jgi:hypothetical protein
LRTTFATLWDGNLDSLEFALVSFKRVGADEGFVVVAVFRLLLFGEPLEGGGWPFEGAEDGEVVLVRGLLFPLLVLLVDDHLLFFVVLLVSGEVP